MLWRIQKLKNKGPYFQELVGLTESELCPRGGELGIRTWNVNQKEITVKIEVSMENVEFKLSFVIEWDIGG